MLLAPATFQIQPTPRATFAAGGAAKLGRQVSALGARRALIVTDPGVVRAGVAARVEASLREAGLETASFSAISPNPTAAEVAAGVALLRGLESAAVVALGGGSAMDAAKLLALMAPNEALTPRDCHPACKPAKPGCPVLAVPTTAGTGSETNSYGVITDTAVGRKFLIGHASVLPVSVLLDPLLTLALPAVPTATCGMDVLTHAIEAATSSRTNPFSQGVALRAIGLVREGLLVATRDGQNVEARSAMLVAAHLAGIAFSSAGLGICHAMGHPLSARLGAAHGQALATLLPGVMRFNLGVCASVYAEVALALGVGEAGRSDAENAEAAIAEVERLRREVGCERSLTELGASSALIPALVEDAFMDALMMTTPRMPSPDDVAALYRAAL